ncbi:S4 domain-containing protein YaaA [Streptococcus ovis]|uniref:S4 domain-containing protein YaaA n=1 Tax=Streptococcus ovis TaxID=82806 RepID=UPI000376A51F|nr:S4 domain-containing protein YaaA [Streptococcus ovis]
MEYKLFDDYITLQSLLKTTGILPSGGAIKSYLAEHTVLFNGEKEERRGKKIRIGDRIEIPAQGVIITLVAPSEEEKIQRQEDLQEKEQVAALVKKMNQNLRKTTKTKKQITETKKRPVRFPGT